MPGPRRIGTPALRRRLILIAEKHASAPSVAALANELSRAAGLARHEGWTNERIERAIQDGYDKAHAQHGGPRRIVVGIR